MFTSAVTELRRSLKLILGRDNLVYRAGVAELVDAQDLKSCVLRGVRVRLPPSAPLLIDPAAQTFRSIIIPGSEGSLTHFRPCGAKLGASISSVCSVAEGHIRDSLFTCLSSSVR